MVNNAVICVAGTGSRLGMEIPKCLVEINGKTIIEHQLEILQGIKTINIVVGYKSELVIGLVNKVRQDVNFDI